MPASSPSLLRRPRDLAWALVESGAGLMVLLLVLRLVAWDREVHLIGWNAAGAAPYLAGVPLGVAAAVGRRKVLAVLSALSLVGAVSLVVPVARASEPLPPGARTAPSFRVLSWNIRYGSARGSAAKAIAREQPDVVLLQEYTPAAQEALAGALDGYTVAVSDPRSDAFGVLIASRLPLVGTGRQDGDNSGIAWATFTTAGRPVRIVDVHALNPFAGIGVWEDELAALGRFARSAGPPTALIGDFNADWGNRSFRRMLGDDLTEASAARGHLWQPTWRPAPWLPPVLRLDHVVTTRGLAVTDLDPGTGGASDHRAVRATVAVVAG